MDEQKYKLFCMARRIADMVFELKEDRFLIDTRSQGTNSYYNQTESGLYLELYYSLPNRLWTPWGTWHFGNSGSGEMQEILETLFARLGATVHQPVVVDSNGQYGPVYALHMVDGEPLPEPTTRERESYISYKAAKHEWDAMIERYQSEMQEHSTFDEGRSIS